MHLVKSLTLRHGATGEAQDRTTISYTINEGERAKAFDVMFALGEPPRLSHGQQLLAPTSSCSHCDRCKPARQWFA